MNTETVTEAAKGVSAGRWPHSLTVVAAIFILGGGLAVIEIIYSIVQGGFSLNFGVCMLFVGLGLLKGKPSSREWALRWLMLIFLASVLFVVPDS